MEKKLNVCKTLKTARPLPSGAIFGTMKSFLNVIGIKLNNC